MEPASHSGRRPSTPAPSRAGPGPSPPEAEAGSQAPTRTSPPRPSHLPMHKADSELAPACEQSSYRRATPTRVITTRCVISARRRVSHGACSLSGHRGSAWAQAPDIIQCHDVSLHRSGFGDAFHSAAGPGQPAWPRRPSRKHRREPPIRSVADSYAVPAECPAREDLRVSHGTSRDMRLLAGRRRPAGTTA